MGSESDNQSTQSQENLAIIVWSVHRLGSMWQRTGKLIRIDGYIAEWLQLMAISWLIMFGSQQQLIRCGCQTDLA